MGLLLGSFWLELALVFAASLYLFYRWGKKKYRFFEERGIPYLEPTFLVGNTWQALLGFEQIGELHRKIYDKLKGAKVGGIFQAFTPIYIVRDPETVHKVLIKDFSNFQDRGIKIDEEVNPLDGNLFLISGDKWRTLRYKLAPTFTSGKLRWMFEQMEVCSDMLLQVLEREAEGKDEVEIRDVLARFTTDVIGSSVFGLEPESIKDPKCKFREMGSKIFTPDFVQVLQGALRFAAPEISQALKMKTVPQDVNDFFMSVLKQTMDQRQESGCKRNDFVELLLQLRNKGSIDVDPKEHTDDFLDQLGEIPKDVKIDLNDNVLTAQAFVFFFAGFETSATSMSFAFYLLAKHPEAQNKVREEIRRVKEKHGRFSYDAIKEMTYLDCCFNEALRMYAPIPVLFRECGKTTTLYEGLTIEKGSQCIVPVSGIHMDPEIYPDPETYRPERFEEGQGSEPGTFLPFGDGPRICIGKRFALVEVKIGMAKILDRYSVELSERMKGVPVDLHPRAFITMPRKGIWLKVKRLET